MWHFLLVYAVFLGALASPGPDFLVVLRQTLSGSSRTGIWAALGVAAGIAVHMSYCLAGSGF